MRAARACGPADDGHLHARMCKILGLSIKRPLLACEGGTDGLAKRIWIQRLGHTIVDNSAVHGPWELQVMG